MLVIVYLFISSVRVDQRYSTLPINLNICNDYFVVLDDWQVWLEQCTVAITEVGFSDNLPSGTAMSFDLFGYFIVLRDSLSVSTRTLL